MQAVRDVTIPSPAQRPRLMPVRGGTHAAANTAIFFLYLLVMGGVSIHLYRRPVYDVDAIQYMGNALLMEETDIGRIHQRVYADVQRSIPQRDWQSLVGEEPGAPEAQNKSRQGRAASASRYAEFLPLFAIRPLYNQTLWLVSKSG